MQVMRFYKEKARMRCPYCKSHGVAERSRSVTENVREITYRCQNPDCQSRWVAHLQAVRVLTPPLKDEDDTVLPMSAKQQTRRMQS